MTRIVDRSRHQYCGAAVIVEAGPQTEVLNDASDDSLLSLASAHQAFHLRPSLHLPIHVTALCAVALVHEHIKATVDRRRRADEVCYIKLVNERTHQTRRRSAELRQEIIARCNTRRWCLRTDHSRVFHDSRD